MSKKRLDLNWDRAVGKEDFKPALKRNSRYLQDRGLRESTVASYVLRAGKFLEFAQEDTPQEEEFNRFRHPS